MNKAFIAVVPLVCALGWFSERALGEEKRAHDRAAAALPRMCRCTCSSEFVESGPIWQRVETWLNISRAACAAKTGLYCWIDEPGLPRTTVSHIGKRKDCRLVFSTGEVPKTPPATAKP